MVGEVAKVIVDHQPSSFYVLSTYSYVCKVNVSFEIWMRSSAPEPLTLIPVNISLNRVEHCPMQYGRTILDRKR